MKKHDIAITTVSWARDHHEEKIIFESLQKLSELELPIIVADRGSPYSFVKKMRTLPNVNILEAEDLTDQLIQSHQIASEFGENLFYIAPDRQDFVEKYAHEFVEKFRTFTKPTLFSASRTPKSFATYPQFQQRAEGFVSYVIGDYVGHEEDYLFGPKIYPASLVHYFKFITGNLGWGLEAFVYVVAHRLGIKFDFLPCTVDAPKDFLRNANEQKLYRLTVAKWEMRGFLEGLQIKI